MKKNKILSLFLALMMICAVLPDAETAADRAPKEVTACKQSEKPTTKSLRRSLRT